MSKHRQTNQVIAGFELMVQLICVGAVLPLVVGCLLYCAMSVIACDTSRHPKYNQTCDHLNVGRWIFVTITMLIPIQRIKWSTKHVLKSVY